MRQALIFILALLCSCTSGEGLVRGIAGGETASPAAGYSSISTKEDGCTTIHLQWMDHRSWKHLSKINFYTRKSKSGKRFRLPPIAFFHVIVKNNAQEPIEVEKIHLIYGKSLSGPLEDFNITETYKSPVYDFFDFHALLTYRRLLSPFPAVNEINYVQDTEPFDKNEIPPSAAVLKILAFPWIPAEYKTFTVRFIVRCAGGKKSIDFNLHRFEYRPKDEYFNGTSIK